MARLPQGAIVLPGLDLHLDAESWAAIAEHPEHPQFGFAKLLAALGVERADVQLLPGADLSAAGEAREALITEAMRPSGMTGRWQQYIATADADAVRKALQPASASSRRRRRRTRPRPSRSYCARRRKRRAAPPRSSHPTGCSPAASLCAWKPGASASTTGPGARSPRRRPARSSISSSPLPPRTSRRPP